MNFEMRIATVPTLVEQDQCIDRETRDRVCYRTGSGSDRIQARQYSRRNERYIHSDWDVQRVKV